MNETIVESPGVYINQINTFPNSIVAVPKSVPVFIGYTPQAMYEGEPYTNAPRKVV
ncbi:MAG: phage tail sheath protein FI [Flavobacteriaceae bacterium]|jgi:phage tail sheath protein FI